MKPVLLACLLALVGCERADRPERPLPQGFRAQRLDGSTVDADSLRGRPWVIAIWVPGCHVCARELPELEKLRREYEPQGVGFLSLSVDADADKARAFLHRLGLPDGTLALADGEVLAPLNVRDVPSTVWLDARALIVAAATGERSSAFLHEQTEALLNAQVTADR